MARSFQIRDRSFTLDGRPLLLFAGEMHYFRIPREYWQHRLRAARAMGLNAICTYMPWNLHEPTPGVFDFSGMLDVVEYLRLAAAKKGCSSSCDRGRTSARNGSSAGCPSWLLKTADIQLRCSDPRYVDAVKSYLREGRRSLRRRCKSIAAGRSFSCRWKTNTARSATTVRLHERDGENGSRSRLRRRALHLRLGETVRTSKRAKSSGAITVANFGSRAAEQITELRRIRPNQPSDVRRVLVRLVRRVGQATRRLARSHASARRAEMDDRERLLVLQLLHVPRRHLLRADGRARITTTPTRRPSAATTTGPRSMKPAE